MFVAKESHRLMQYSCIFLFTATFDDIETAQIYDLRKTFALYVYTAMYVKSSQSISIDIIESKFKSGLQKL